MWTNILILLVSVSYVVHSTIIQIQQWIPGEEGHVSTDSPNSTHYARWVGDCARACSTTVTSLSFFFVEDTKECQCHDVQTHPSLVYKPSATYFKRGAAVPTVFSCPVDNLSFRRVVLSDGSQFQYRTFMNASLTFEEAVTKCSEEKSTVLEVLSLEKFNFVVELMACPGFTAKSLWINGEYNATNDQWETTVGAPLPMSNDFWANGKPSGNGGSGTEKCVYMSQSGDHKWVNRPCTNDPQLIVLCEMP